MLAADQRTQGRAVSSGEMGGQGGDEMRQPDEEKGSAAGFLARPLLLIVAGGAALSAIAILVLLLIASAHMIVKAKCSPLEDPRIEIVEPPEDCERDCAPPRFRASVRVEGDCAVPVFPIAVRVETEKGADPCHGCST